MADDEPYDSLGGNGPVRSKSSTPSAPPSFAFDHGGNMPTPGKSAAPPPSVFGKKASPTVTLSPDMMDDDGDYDDDELGAIPSRARGSEQQQAPSVMSTQLNDRWKQYETQMENHRSESSLENRKSSSSNHEPEPYSSYKLSSNARAELAPRQPYSFRKSNSYDTDELIRKYGVMAGVPPVVSSYRPTVASIPPPAADVRNQAQRMLELVDDHLKTPLDVRRTESGGFRAAPITEEDPYSLQRSSSVSSTGKRVPAALSGLNFSKSTSNSYKEPGRYSFSDPSFRDDDHMSDDEDVIIRHKNIPEVPFEDEPVVDVVGMESRAAGMRAPYRDDEKKFEGDFDGGSKSWSSRYSDTSAYVSQKHVLEQWDREFEKGEGRKSARNMFMSTASSLRTSANDVFAAAGNERQKIFGSGGFSFRANHVFGHHKSASERNEVNLRTVWREVDDETLPVGLPPVHKTWQEVMLNKRKRRRILAIIVLFVLGGVAVSSALGAIKKRKAQPALFAGSDVGQRITFHVTSGTPTSRASEDQLEKDLYNIPIDSEFVVHLGNIQDASVSFCPKTRYEEAASMLVKSPLPVFIIPGADDWTKCPDQEASFTRWMHAFKNFDLKFKHAYDVKRDINNPEAFCFLHKGVLFMGLHIVSGPVVEDDAWVDRQKEMLKFFFGMANVNKGNYRSLVLLGNAKPSAQQKLFFDALFSNLKEDHPPIVYIHANHKGDEVLQYNPFEGHPEIPVIEVQNGSEHPLLKVTVGFGERPVMIG